MALIMNRRPIRAQIAYTNKLNANGDSEKKKRTVPPSTVGNTLLLRRAPPFIPAHDIVRGILHAGQAAFSFAFMLVVMLVFNNCVPLV